MKTTDRQGDSWEYLVLYKASRKKCEVTRNAFKQGPYDLVLHIDGKSYKCDVKADTSRYTTVEGEKTAKAAVLIANKYRLDLPIIQTVSDLINENIEITKAIQNLIERPLKKET